MRCGVVTFPGSNCDHDVYHVLKHVLGQEVRFLWHDADNLHGSELVVLPGGFSYGDYVRAGAMAALSPIMGAVRAHADAGGMVLGIAVLRTGLGTRMAEAVLLRVGQSHNRVLFGVAVAAFALSLVMPSAMSRVVLLVPIVVALADRMGYAPGSAGRDGLILAATFSTALCASKSSLCSANSEKLRSCATQPRWVSVSK